MKHKRWSGLGIFFCGLWVISGIAIIAFHYYRMKPVQVSGLGFAPYSKDVIGASDYQSPFWHSELSRSPTRIGVPTSELVDVSSGQTLMKIVPNYFTILFTIFIPPFLGWFIYWIFQFTNIWRKR